MRPIGGCLRRGPRNGRLPTATAQRLSERRPGPSTPPASTSTAASTTADKGKATSATDKAAADKGAPAAGGDKAAADKTADKADVMDEAAWRKKVTDARNQLDRSQSFAEALQT